MSYYIEHSITTHPGQYANLFDVLDDDFSRLCHIVQGLILHYADEEMHQYKIPKHRYQEMDVRYVKDMLKLILTYDSSPLNMVRQANRRVIGVCRDNSALICSILRHKKIPVRLRVGFVDYVIPGIYLDGVCVEYWNQENQKWCLADTRTTNVHIDKFNINGDLNLHDLPRGSRFISAAEAWQLCRSKQYNPNRFGSRMHRGLWYIRNRLLQDFAFLNKQEGLIWDLWGMMLISDYNGKPSVPDSQLRLLDDLSQFITHHSYDVNLILEYHNAHDYLHLPNEILVDNPFFESRMFTNDSHF